jgi:hypothetical protein
MALQFDQYNNQLKVSDTTNTNAPIVLQPQGSGALQAQLADGTTVGGNARGINSTDWQTDRTNANQVASGQYSFIGGGRNNRASGNYSIVVGGNSGTASGANSTIIGGGLFSGNTASGDASVIAGGWGNSAQGQASVINGGNANTANGAYSTIAGGVCGSTKGIISLIAFPACNQPFGFIPGGSQGALLIIAAQTTDATATALRCDGNAASSTNQIILPNNSAYYFRGSVIAGVTGGGDSKGWTIEGVIKRGANAGSTAFVGTPTVTSAFADAGAATWTIAVTVDATNGGLRVTVTGQASTIIRWVAKIETTEMGF